MIQHPHAFFWLAFFAGFMTASMVWSAYMALNTRRQVKKLVDAAELIMKQRRADFAVQLMKDGLEIRKTLRQTEGL